MSWLGALISGGASILSGLLGGKKDKPVTTTSYVDYSRMVREAEAAGFNPLTAIRNGGSAGFTVSSSSGGATQTPLSRIAGSLPGMVDNFLTQIDPFNDKSREMQYRIQEAQLANLQADTAARNRVSIGGVPSVTGGTRARRPVASNIPHGSTNISLPAVAAGGGTYADPGTWVDYGKKMPDLENVVSTVPGAAVPTKNPLASQPPQTKRPDRVNPYPSWMGWEKNPWTAGGQAFEDGIGDTEIGGSLNSASEFAHDYAWNAYRYWERDAKPTLKRWGGALSGSLNDKKKRPVLDRPWWENPTNIPPPLLDPRRFR